MRSRKNKLDETLSHYLHAPGSFWRELSDASRAKIMESTIDASSEPEHPPQQVPRPSRWRRPLVAAGLSTAIVFSALIALYSQRQNLNTGEIIRTHESPRVLTLADGSLVEMRSHSDLSTETVNDGVRIHLIKGDVIVTAAKQAAGRHLYVLTKDAKISVVGTVFLVRAETEGSRIAVIEGEVRVQQGTTITTLLPGQQIATNPTMEAGTLKEELLWSPRVGTHAALLQQTSSSSPPSSLPKLQFEVAALKRVGRGDIEDGKFGPRPLEIRCKGVDETWSSANRTESVNLSVQGRCLGIGFLGQLIGFAFDLPNERVSGPVPYEPYQLDAKAANPATATLAELKEMFRNMIVDRLKLKTHSEFKEEQGYALRIADGGIKFKESSLGEIATASRGTPGCDFYCWDGRFRIKRFAYGLGSMTGTKPIADLTGLRGIYEFKFTLNRVEDGPTAAANGPRGTNGVGDPPKAQFDPPISKALEQQLGLRLDPGKVPIEYIVVDSMERPSED